VDSSSNFCPFSATVDVPLFAPGCDLDFADPSTDSPDCCGNGTSQASAFTSAVLTALMSYDPALSYSAAEQLLISTAYYDRLDVAAAFDAAGLSSIVAEGSAAIPQSAPATSPVAASSPTQLVSPNVKVQRATWAGGSLRLVVSGLPRGDHLEVEVKYRDHRTRRVSRTKSTVVLRTARPTEVLVTVWNGTKQIDGPITVRVA
jgi:hypothetical protein